jgi:lipopolysaccharide export LptBFGC system permease protein LptF
MSIENERRPGYTERNREARERFNGLWGAIVSAVALGVMLIMCLATKDYWPAVYGMITWFCAMVIVAAISNYRYPKPKGS